MFARFLFVTTCSQLTTFHHCNQTWEVDNVKVRGKLNCRQVKRGPQLTAAMYSARLFCRKGESAGLAPNQVAGGGVPLFAHCFPPTWYLR
jgi:hypothetical protein